MDIKEVGILAEEEEDTSYKVQFKTNSPFMVEFQAIILGEKLKQHIQVRGTWTTYLIGFDNSVPAGDYSCNYPGGCLCIDWV